MARFEHTSTIEAPFERVWAFHTDTDGLEAITPDWVGLTVESITGPEGNDLVPGTEINITVEPFGVIPGGRWVSRITARRRTAEGGLFRDEMVAGPLDRWIHTHRFVETTDGTILHDAIDYRLPGPTPSTLAWPALAVIFEYRHRLTATLLAS